ncbi:MAG: kelch repeat-containing protein [Paracoccus sp. (in: a-proteobacteria)]|uniref:Kelch repeat-containing protein n=1 Tax=Paracoccus sp. TaxID=267 RepID=UPI0039E6C8E4
MTTKETAANPSRDPSGQASPAGLWTKGTPAPIERSEVAVAAIDGKGYVVGDIRGAEDMLVYDIAGDSWTRVPAPQAIHHPTAASWGGKLYVFGGFVGMSPARAQTVAWVYDPATGRWDDLPPLPTARAAGVAVALDGRIHVISGATDILIDVPSGTRNPAEDAVLTGTNTGAHEVFDIALGRWESRAPLPTPRDHTSAGAIDGKIVVAGGRFALDPRVNVDLVDIYDPATDSWTYGARMPTPRSASAFAVLNGALYTFGGETRFSLHDEAESYDLATNRWRRHSSLPEGRHGFGAVEHGGRLYTLVGSTVPFRSGGEAAALIFSPDPA